MPKISLLLAFNLPRSALLYLVSYFNCSDNSSSWPPFNSLPLLHSVKAGRIQQVMDVFEGFSLETFEVERSLLEFEEGIKQLGVQAHDEAQRIWGAFTFVCSTTLSLSRFFLRSVQAALPTCRL